MFPRSLAIPILASLLLATQFLAAQEGGGEAKPAKKQLLLPRLIEFELALWDARLGLEDRQLRELQHAARGAVEELKAVNEAAEGKEFDVHPWAEHKSEAEPWRSLQIPRALKAKSFVIVAEVVLTKKQLAGLVAMKQQLKLQQRGEMQSARAHQRAGTLTKKLSLTEAQVEDLVALLRQRSKARRQLVEKFKGREEQIPDPAPLRDDPAFIKLLDANQKRLLEKREKPEEEDGAPARPQQL